MAFNVKNPSLQALDDQVTALLAFALDMTDNAWALFRPVVDGSSNVIGVQMYPADPIQSSHSAGLTALTSATTATLATLSLEPGWYELTGVVRYTITGGTVSLNYAAQGAHNVAATLPGVGDRSVHLLQAVPVIDPELPILRRIVQVTATTDWHLVARAQWGGGGTLSAEGFLKARQIGIFEP